MKIGIKKLLGFSGIAIVTAVTVIANSIVLEPTLSQNITGLLCPPLIDQEALGAQRESGQALSRQIVQEGSVLVKNDNNTLPLSADVSKVNVFGHAAIDWVYGGSGSGQVIPENNNAAENIDFLKALTEYDVEYNQSLTKMYNNFMAPIGDIGSISTFYDSFYRLCEPDITDKTYYTDALLNEAKNFSDTAIVVIGRHAGETEDPTRVQYKHKAVTDKERHYLEISKEEEGMLRYVGETYENVIVLINSTNTMELDFVESIPGIDACLVVGATGTRGAQEIPALLWGEHQPSGRFADTYAYDMSTNVNWNFTSAQGIGHYTGASDVYPTGAGCNAGVSTRTAPAYIDYIEGIYVGYKWYETADAMNYWKDYTRTVYDAAGKEVTLTGYDSVVQYPFGYGLSYTTFDWSLMEVTPKAGDVITLDTEIKFTINVTNTGSMSGQDVVEAYVTVPYTAGGIEKSHVSLVGYAKTAVLAPGASQALTITIDPYDFSSYDCYDKNANGFMGYELEAGDYQIKLMTDSHNIKTLNNNGIASEGVYTYKVENSVKIEKDRYTGTKVENLFTGTSAKDGVAIDGSDSQQNISFISREKFPALNTLAATASRAMAAAMKENNTYSQSEAAAWDNATTDYWGNAVSDSAVAWGSTQGTVDVTANNYELGYKLGADYNAPEWEAVLNKITLSEAVNLVRSGSFGNAAIGSIGKPRLSDYDGPAQVRSFNAGATRGTGFPCSTVLAQTWNPSLAYSFGLNYGKEMNALGVDGVYGFGCNMHRSAWGGRNYEYLSEDAFLSAEMLTQEVKALKNTGHYTYLKHLALYETEHERDSMYTWLTEQALREIYLKPFQVAIQEGGCVGLMSSYNRIGDNWTGGSDSLITGVVRNEWGFNGMIVTDYVDSWSQGFMSIEDAVRAGGDILLGGRNTSLDTGFAASNRIQNQVREVCHHVLYAWLSAKYTNNIYNESADVEQIISTNSTQSWVWWQPLLIDIDILVGGLCLIGLLNVFSKPMTKEQKAAAKVQAKEKKQAKKDKKDKKSAKKAEKKAAKKA